MGRPDRDPSPFEEPTMRQLALLSLCLACFTGCAVKDSTIIAQADQSHAGLKPAVMSDAQLANYIQSVGDRIVAAAKQADADGVGPKAHFSDQDRQWMFSKDMRFHFVNSKTLNAFTTGGEHMYVYTALLEKCADENDLAAVMAHEYAHVYCRHVQKGTQRQYGVIGAALAAGAAGAVYGGKEKGAEYATTAGGAAMALGQLAGTQFTRGDEAEADEYGFYFYTRAGWDPKRFGHFFQTLKDQNMDQGVEILSDHPSLESRVKVAEQRAEKLGPDASRWQRPPVASADKFRQIQQRALALGAKMPDDKSLAQAQELLQALPRSCLTPAIQQDQIDARKRLQKDLEDQERRQSAKKA
jgi:predicted Zn-dependent protease